MSPNKFFFASIYFQNICLKTRFYQIYLLIGVLIILIIKGLADLKMDYFRQA